MSRHVISLFLICLATGLSLFGLSCVESLAVAVKTADKNKTRPEHLSSAKQSLKTGSKKQLANYDPQIEVGPFDIHRKYRSMEGPYVMRKFLISDLVDSGKIQLPAGMVTYIDSPGANGAPSMMAGSSAESKGEPLGLVHSENKPTELLWFRGIKIQVLDENDKPLPTAEFICHMNLDVDQVTRYAAFPELERSGGERIITLTQGQTEFHFPDGFAVPVSSDEEWKFTFQAANRTTNAHRRIKHLCTLSFVRDADLKMSPKALHWYNNYLAVEAKNSFDFLPHFGPGCLQMSHGDSAPNMVPGTNFNDAQGRLLAAHWAIPPGLHNYQMPMSALLDDKDFNSEDRVVHAVWTHIHPACTNAALVECNGDTQKKIINVNASTAFSSGPELKHIDTILSKDGILVKAGKNYALSATYNNPLKEALDSMVVFGFFCESKKFVHPDWTTGQTELKRNSATAKSPSNECNDLYCGIMPKKK